MTVSVKSKIQLGTLFLFLLLLLTGGAGIYSTVVLKDEAKDLLKDNYESIYYCHAMQQQLDSLRFNYPQAVGKFESVLRKQEYNITEQGELEATRVLRGHFNRIKAGDTSRQSILNIETEIQKILSLNMSAVQKKNENVQKRAEKAVTIIVGLVGVVFLIAFTFSFNFPSIVTGPIEKLSEAIKEISNKNYKHRVHIENKDEFGDLANAFNNMTQRLEYFESSNLNKLMFEKSRAEAVINSLRDASIGIDKNDMILFANYQALQLLGSQSVDVVGKTVDELSKRNDLFNFLVKDESPAPFKIVVNDRENYFTKEFIEVTQGESQNRVIVLKNITSFKELDVAKTNFIATISHELENALGSL